MVKEFNSFPPLRLYLFIREHSDIYSNILLPNNTLRFSNEMNMVEQTTQIILQENLILPITLAVFFFFQTLYSANTKHNHYGFFNFKRVEDFQIYSRSDEMFLNVQDL